ncbi:MAG: ATP-binding protein [Anaerolineales bacterium]
MSIAGWGLESSFYLGLPFREAGYLLLGFYLLILGLCVRKPAIRLPRQLGRLLLFPAGLLLAALVLSGAFTVRLSTDIAAPEPLQPGAGPSFPLFGATPWMIAAGFVGDLPAALLGLTGGLVRGGWGTQRLLTPFGIAAEAALFSWLIRRPYSEWPGRMARRPLPSALATGLIFGLLRSAQDFVYAPGDFLGALDQTTAALGPTVLASALELGFAGLLTAALRAGFARHWQAPAQLILGPYNRTLAARLVTVVVSLGLAGGAALTYGNWLLSRSSAQSIISDQMLQTASQVAEGIPFFIQTGRTQIRSIAESLPEPVAASEISADALTAAMEDRAYFSRLAVLDAQGAAWAFWPAAAGVAREVELASRTGAPQELVLGGSLPADGIQLVFLTPLDAGGARGMLVGWTDLDRNPILEPVNARLASYATGEALVADDRGRVILHADPDRWLQPVGYPDSASAAFFHAPDSTGNRSWVYSLQVEGYPWRVIVSTPQSSLDALALSTTVNLFLLLVSLGGVLIAAVHLSSRRLTQPLRDMASTAEAIALGDLDRQVPAGGEDEIGRLAGSFERMRQALKARLGELNLLLATSRRMAESFDLAEGLPIVLNRMRDLIDVDCVRLVLAGSEGELEAYQAGSAGKGWANLDQGILDLTRKRGQFSLENPARAGAVLDLGGVSDGLEALIAFPVKHEAEDLGALWLGHGRPRAFSKSEVRLVSIFAGQLAISVENVGLYRLAERERSRLLAILSSTPDAVIVTDARGRVSLANPAADAVLTVRAEDAIGRPIGELVRAPELAALFTEPLPPSHSLEIKLEGGRVLYASASDVPGGQLGRVCVLSDITHYKVLDALKSEFVSTVSHDLRSPLTLMRGYSSMVANVGAVNNQQQELLDKIQASVARMTKLVDDLLDLGRIETGIGLSLESVEISAVLQEVLTNFRPLALNKQVALEVQLGSSLSPLQADPVLLRQAIGNLVDNAIKYSQPGARVLVRADQIEGRQIIQVQDGGVGIASADQPRLFEKFFRVGEGKGAGLGLAIVKSIVEQHQGRVSVESRLGRGSTFTIAVPMRAERVRAAA